MTKRQSNYIKLVAMASMLIDHIGVVLLPDYTFLRILGRIAFPLFAYQIGIGYENTKCFKKYFLRLFIFGAAIQLFYIAAMQFLSFEFQVKELNIFFTLALGLLAIYFYDNKKYIYFIAVLVISYLAGADYGLYGVALILLLYIARNSDGLILLTLISLGAVFSYFTGSYIQMYSVIAFVFIAKPLELTFDIPYYVFYLFYPVHLLILYLIKTIFKGLFG